MPHRILSEEERTAVFNKFKISEPENQLPWLDSQDAMVKWIGLTPAEAGYVQAAESLGKAVAAIGLLTIAGCVWGLTHPPAKLKQAS